MNILRYILVARCKELLASRLFKFVMVGGFGFLINLVFYNLFNTLKLWTGLSESLGITLQNGILRSLISDESLSVILAAEVAIFSNYLWSNFWTFKDRKIQGVGQHVTKFLTFNLSSVGSVVIQYITMQTAVRLLGIFTLFTLAGISISSDNLYLVAGVLIGMVWNFTMYSKVIWRKK